MPIINPDSKLTGAFFHWLGKVNTKDGNYAGSENYKSAHNVRSNEVWMDDVPVAYTFASASAYSDAYPSIIRKVGTVSSVGNDGLGNDLIGQPGYLYPLHNTLYQSWFLDTGTPSLGNAFGEFIPSDEWVKPIINISDIPDSKGAPSTGYAVILYAPTTGGKFNSVSYDNAYYDIDTFSGIFRFNVGKTPIDSGNGSGYTMDKAAFEAARNTGVTAAIDFIKSVNGGLRAIAYQYVGQTLDTFTKGVTGATGSIGATGATGSDGTSGTSGVSDRYRSVNTLTIDSSQSSWTLSIESGLAYSPGQSIILAIDSLNYIEATVTSYNISTGQLIATKGNTLHPLSSGVIGSPTNASATWVVNLDGASGGDGSSGTSGTSGTSGVDGTSGTSGTSGTTGTSGTSGVDGTSGTSGVDGTSGTSGVDGTSGTSGIDGTSGTSGTSGVDGTSGTSGVDGTSGTSGTSGTTGTSGTSGVDGTSGTSGYNGDKYRADYNSSISWVSGPMNLTISTGLAYSPGQQIIISVDGSNYYQGIVDTYNTGDGSISIINVTKTNSPTGSTYVVNLDGASGGDGSSGTSGTSGINGLSAYETWVQNGSPGNTGTSGVNDFLDAINGSNGTSGTSGTSGVDGTSGTSGTSGVDGTSGTSGTSGIGIPAGGTSGQVLSKIDGTDYNTQWVDQTGGSGGGPTFSLTVEDYLTGATFGNINNIIFRGNTVVVHPAGATATGVLVTEDNPVTQGSVMVWIPAPNYVNFFAPSIGTGDENRYVMNPTSNLISGTTPGEYSIGTWDIGNDFASSTTRSVKVYNTSLTAFTTGTSYFSLSSDTTSITFTLYAGDGATVLRSISATPVNGNYAYTSSPSGLTLTITDWAADNDRWKAKVSGTIDVATLFPYGGRFSWKIEHDNNGVGPGYNNAAAAIPGIYSYSSAPVFYDIDLGSDSQDSSSTIGDVAFDEKTPALVYYSGVAYYDTGSTFGFTVSGIDLLNDTTIPVTKQIDIDAYYMAIAGTLEGYADGSKTSVGTIITGWTSSWNKSGLTFSRNATVNTAGQYIPDFATGVNTLDTSRFSYIKSNIYDLGLAATFTTSVKKMLFDTDTTDSVTYNSNPLDSENGRLSFSGLSNASGKGVHPSASPNQVGTATFSSIIPLNTATDELQYIFGRVIYPQTDFTEYFPLVNQSTAVNYSSLSGVTKSFDIYTALGLSTTDGGAGGGDYTTTSFADFKWHVTSYSKDAVAGTNFTNALFTFNANFRELDMEKAYNPDGSFTINGTPELVVLLGLDSTGANLKPDKFAYISGDADNWGARMDEPTFNFNGAENAKQLRWQIGQWGSTINCRKVWLFIGYRNIARGKQLWITDINLSFPI